MVQIFLMRFKSCLDDIISKAVTGNDQECLFTAHKALHYRLQSILRSLYAFLHNMASTLLQSQVYEMPLEAITYFSCDFVVFKHQNFLDDMVPVRIV